MELLQINHGNVPARNVGILALPPLIA